MLETGDLVLVASAMLGASAFQGFAGFGFNLICTPLLVLIMPVQAAVIMLLFPSWFACWSAAHTLRKEAPWKPIWKYLLYTPIGVLVGVVALEGTPHWILELVLTLLLAHVLLGARFGGFASWLHATPISAFLAGIGAGALGTAGPAVVAWAHAKEDWPIPKRRAATLFIFTVLTPLRLPFYLFFGMMTDPLIWIVAAASLPLVILGSLLGTWVAARTSERATGIALKVAIAALCVTMAVQTVRDYLG